MKKTSSDNHEYVTLMAVGDIMLGDHPICIGHGVGSKIKKEGAKYIFQHVRGLLNEADIAFGNLEAVLSKKNLNEKDVNSASLRAMPESADGLTYAGFNVLSLANNHIMEHGKEALLDTMNILRKNGIKYVGPEDVVLSIRGTKVVFLAYCLLDEPGTCCKAESSEIIENVKRVKSKADIVIVSLHWGDEFIHKPSRYQVKLAHEIIDSGANIILGHHPHVLQGVEMYNGGLIAYSLGNFVFDMWQEKMRESVILKCLISDSTESVR
jgi:poly-gamma-glutamate synthesis protein (capsule biosynthesis protein)